MNYNAMLEKIDLLCSSKGITRTTAFIESGVGKNFAYNINQGKIPSVEKINQIAAYFNVTTDYLLGNDTSASKDPATDEEIKFALFNGSDGVTDEMYEEVKNFAQMVKLREANKQKGKK